MKVRVSTNIDKEAKEKLIKRAASYKNGVAEYVRILIEKDLQIEDKKQASLEIKVKQLEKENQVLKMEYIFNNDEAFKLSGIELVDEKEAIFCKYAGVSE